MSKLNSLKYLTSTMMAAFKPTSVTSTSTALLPIAACMPVSLHNFTCPAPLSHHHHHKPQTKWAFSNSHRFHTSITAFQDSSLSIGDTTNHTNNGNGHQHQQSDVAPLPAGGGVEIIIGPMFAGKTKELLRRVDMYEAQGLKVAIVKSNKDDRYSTSQVVTHDGIAKPCIAVPTLQALTHSSETCYSSCDVIAIDEAQFFTDLISFCSLAADVHNKRIVIAGLDGDFKRQRFGDVLELVPLADSVTKLTAICRFCQEEEEGEDKQGGGGDKARPAIFSLRMLAGEGKQELIGGAEKYAAACRRHYVLHHKDD